MSNNANNNASQTVASLITQLQIENERLQQALDIESYKLVQILETYPSIQPRLQRWLNLLREGVSTKLADVVLTETEREKGDRNNNNDDDDVIDNKTLEKVPTPDYNGNYNEDDQSI